MKRIPYRTAAGVLVAVACVVGLGACDIVGTVPAEAEPARILHIPKMRHAHLMPEASSGKFGADSVDLMIGYDPIYSAQRVVRTYRVFRRYRVVRRYEFENVLDGEAITVPISELGSLLDSLEADPAVAWVEPDYEVPVADVSTDFWWENQQKVSWGVGATSADKSFFRSGDNLDANGIPDVDLYVLDSGADSPDLNVVECLELIGQAFGPCRNAHDMLGHGTAVAGVAAAKDDNQGLVGVAPGVPVRVIRTLNAAGNSNESRMVAAIDLVTKRKLDNPSRPVVLNLSFGANVGTMAFTAMDDAVQAAINAGVTVVVSAGNDGKDASLYSPAHVPDAITVGAYSSSGALSAFSNRGPMVDILAPGDRLEVLFAGSDPNKLMRESGTSFAAPHVAGAAVVLLHHNPTWTPAQVRSHLVNTAATVRSPSGTTARALNMNGLGAR